MTHNMITPNTIAIIENIEALIGEEVGLSNWETIDQLRIDAFAANTGDRQWIHVDADRAARESPHGATIAHGYLLLSLLAPTTLDLLTTPVRFRTTINYGINRVRFLAPVKTGSRVRNRIKLIATEDKGNGRTLITTENALEVEGEAKPALIAQTLWMVVR